MWKIENHAMSKFLTKQGKTPEIILEKMSSVYGVSRLGNTTGFYFKQGRDSSMMILGLQKQPENPYRKNEEDISDRIVTEDETWLHITKLPFSSGLPSNDYCFVPKI